MSQENSQKRGIGEKIGIVVIILLVILIVCTFVVYGLFKDVDAAPSLFGYRIYIMNNDTMGEQIKGSAVFIKEGLMPSNEGNIILVSCPDTNESQDLQNSDGADDSVKDKLAIVTYCGTHDVTMPDGSVQAKHIVKYSNAPDDKRWVVDTENIIGKAESYDPVMGAIIRFVSSKAGMLVMVIIPCGLIVIYEVIMLIISIQRKRSEVSSGYDDDYGYSKNPEAFESKENALKFGRHSESKSQSKSISSKPDHTDFAESKKPEEAYPERTIAFDFNRHSGKAKSESDYPENIAPVQKAPNRSEENIGFHSEPRTPAVDRSTVPPTAPKAKVPVSPAPTVSNAATTFTSESKPKTAPAAPAEDKRDSSQRIDELMRMLREETEKLSKK